MHYSRKKTSEIVEAWIVLCCAHFVLLSQHDLSNVSAPELMVVFVAS